MYCRSPSLPRTDKVIMLTRWLSGFLGSRWVSTIFRCHFRWPKIFQHFFCCTKHSQISGTSSSPRRLRLARNANAAQARNAVGENTTSPPVGIKMAGTTTWTPTFPAFVNFWVFHAACKLLTRCLLESKVQAVGICQNATKSGWLQSRPRGSCYWVRCPVDVDGIYCCLLIDRAEVVHGLGPRDQFEAGNRLHRGSHCPIWLFLVEPEVPSERWR